VGADDFNGDGTADLLLWQASSDTFSILVSDPWGAPLAFAVPLHGEDQTEVGEPLAVVRMKEDTAPRLLWSGANGEVGYGRIVTRMGLITYERGGFLAGVQNNSTKLVSAADFDYDGRTDLLWQDGDKSLRVCLGPTFTQCASLDPPELLNPWDRDLLWAIIAAQ
jgi:hypothetical protein